MDRGAAAQHRHGARRKPDILQASMTLLVEAASPPQSRGPAGRLWAHGVPHHHNADNTLATFRFKLKDVKMFAAEDAFKSGTAVRRRLVHRQDGRQSDDLRARLESAAAALGIAVYASEEVPKVAMHELAAPRIALVHTWTNTQNEGWFRVAFDRLQIPYDYISDQKLRATANLRDKWDVFCSARWAGRRSASSTACHARRSDPVEE